MPVLVFKKVVFQSDAHSKHYIKFEYFNLILFPQVDARTYTENFGQSLVNKV